MAKVFLQAIPGNATKTQNVFAKCCHIFKAVFACVHITSLARNLGVASQRLTGCLTVRSSRADGWPGLLVGQIALYKGVAALWGMTTFPQT